MVSIAPITENVQKMSKLKTDLTFSTLDGNYKDYKNAHKQLASLAIQDFDSFKNAQSIKVSGHVPLFSKTFWKMAKVMLLSKLHIKTADEKQFAEMCKEEEKKQQFRDAVRTRIEQHYRSDIDTIYKEKIDALITEKTDKTMGFISRADLDMLAEEDIRTKGADRESLINSAIKYHPMYFMRQYKEELDTTIYNKKFIEEINKNR